MDDKLSRLLGVTNSKLAKGYKFEHDFEKDCFKLIREKAIADDSELIDEHVADVYVMEDFIDFIADQAEFIMTRAK